MKDMERLRLLKQARALLAESMEILKDIEQKCLQKQAEKEQEAA